MKSRFVLSLFAAVAAVALVGFTAGDALAGHAVTATLTVPAGLNPNDLHLTFTGTGGTIVNQAVDPVGVATVSGGGNTIDVDWGAGVGNKLAPGTLVTVTFICRFDGIGVASGTWTNDGTEIGTISSGDVAIVVVDPAVPGASPMVMLLIAMAVAAGGVLMLRRRVEA